MSMAPSHPRRPTFAAVLLTVGLALAAPVATFAQGPSISVEPASIGPGSTTLTVTGSGFSTTGNGVYVVFGPIATAPVYYSDPSIYGAFRWVHAGAGESPAEAVLAPDGSFSTTLEVTSTFTTPAGDIDCATSVCAVITFAAHGSPDRSQDTCVPLLGGRIASPTGAGADASPGDGVASWATDPCAPITGDPAASAAPVGPSVPSVPPSLAP